MRASYLQKKAFIRRIYREATEASEASRNAYLDTIDETAQLQVDSGVRRVGASGGGFSSSFAPFSGWDPRDVVEFTEWARGYISEADVDDALESIPGPVTHFGTDFRLVRI